MDEQPKFNRSGSLVMSRSKNKNNIAKSIRSSPEDLNDQDCMRLREDAFQSWLQSKRKEQLRKCKEERKIKQMSQEQEQIKKEAAELSYAIWKHKKDEEKKAKEVKERKLKEKQELEIGLKKTISRERVSQWMKSSKYKPRPVPSNMGLLSLTVTNPPSFYNPHPWISPEPA